MANVSLVHFHPRPSSPHFYFVVHNFYYNSAHFLLTYFPQRLLTNGGISAMLIFWHAHLFCPLLEGHSRISEYMYVHMYIHIMWLVDCSKLTRNKRHEGLYLNSALKRYCFHLCLLSDIRNTYELFLLFYKTLIFMRERFIIVWQSRMIARKERDFSLAMHKENHIVTCVIIRRQ